MAVISGVEVGSGVGVSVGVSVAGIFVSVGFSVGVTVVSVTVDVADPLGNCPSPAGAGPQAYKSASIGIRVEPCCPPTGIIPPVQEISLLAKVLPYQKMLSNENYPPGFILPETEPSQGSPASRYFISLGKASLLAPDNPYVVRLFLGIGFETRLSS